jgi:hypothetical protein
VQRLAFLLQDCDARLELGEPRVQRDYIEFGRQRHGVIAAQLPRAFTIDRAQLARRNVRVWCPRNADRSMPSSNQGGSFPVAPTSGGTDDGNNDYPSASRSS